MKQNCQLLYLYNATYAEICPTLRSVLCLVYYSDVIFLKFLLSLEQRGPHFHLWLRPATYVASSMWNAYGLLQEPMRGWNGRLLTCAWLSLVVADRRRTWPQLRRCSIAEAHSEGADIWAGNLGSLSLCPLPTQHPFIQFCVKILSQDFKDNFNPPIFSSHYKYIKTLRESKPSFKVISFHHEKIPGKRIQIISIAFFLWEGISDIY